MANNESGIPEAYKGLLRMTVDLRKSDVVLVMILGSLWVLSLETQIRFSFRLFTIATIGIG